MHRCVAFLSVLGALVGMAVTTSASVSALDMRRDVRTLILAPQMTVLEDVSTALTLSEVLARTADFHPVLDERPNLGMTGSAFWFHVTLSGLGQIEGRWLIEVASPILDDVTVYFTDAGNVIDSQFAGDMRAFSSRPYNHRNPVFPIPESESSEIDIWVRVASDGTMVVPITLWREDAYLRADGGVLMFFGGYFGLLVTLMVYNAFLLLAVRDNAYLFYVLYLGGTALLQLTLTGFGGQYLWPNVSELSNTMTIVFFAVTIAAGAFFVSQIFDLRRRQRVLAGMLSVLAAAAIPAAIVGIWVSYPHGLRLMMLVTLVEVCVIAAAGIHGLASGYRPARFVLLAFATLAPGAVLLILRTTGWVPSNLLTDHAIELSTACEAILLSFALADRINLLETEKTAAQMETVRAQARFSRDLIKNQETDRRQIAGELHDSIGQSLLVLRNALRRMAEKLEQPDVADELIDLSDQVRGTLDETRALSRLLHPHQLENLGLIPAIREMVEQAFATAGIDCETHLEPVDELLLQENHIHAFRFVQEAVSNVIKHARARRCSVRLARNGDGVEIRVEDDGRGLNWSDGVGAGFPGGHGLAMLRERVTLMDGEFSVEPGAIGGTAVMARVPSLRKS